MKKSVIRSLAVAITLMFSAATIASALALPTKFKGQAVTVMVRGGQNGQNLYLWGTCTDMDEAGIWIDQTHVKYMPQGTLESKEAGVYIPWSAITFVKPDKS